MTAIEVNGQPWEGPGSLTIGGLVAVWCPSPRGVAVARNGEVVSKSAWEATLVGEGDRIEIVTAAAGG